MFTSKNGIVPHNHRVEIDGNGNGYTLDTNFGTPHTHEIKDFEVLAGGVDKHTHDKLEPPNRKFSHMDGENAEYKEREYSSTKEAIMERKEELEREDGRNININVHVT